VTFAFPFSGYADNYRLNWQIQGLNAVCAAPSDVSAVLPMIPLLLGWLGGRRRRTEFSPVWDSTTFVGSKIFNNLL
jgi:uncharacterized protein (TIGR03382 family)